MISRASVTRFQKSEVNRDPLSDTILLGSPLSRTWHDRLLGAGAGTTLTLVALWLVLVSAATAVVIRRA